MYHKNSESYNSTGHDCITVLAISRHFLTFFGIDGSYDICTPLGPSGRGIHEPRNHGRIRRGHQHPILIILLRHLVLSTIFSAISLIWVTSTTLFPIWRWPIRGRGWLVRGPIITIHPRWLLGPRYHVVVPVIRMNTWSRLASLVGVDCRPVRIVLILARSTPSRLLGLFVPAIGRELAASGYGLPLTPIHVA